METKLSDFHKIKRMRIRQEQNERIISWGSGNLGTISAAGIAACRTAGDAGWNFWTKDLCSRGKSNGQQRKVCGKRSTVEPSTALFTWVRYKGLGEMNATQLWDTTMNPESRTLLCVTIENAMMAEKRVTELMGDKAELRRNWIEDNVVFTLEDDYKEVNA